MNDFSNINNERDKIILTAYHRLNSLRKTSELLGIPKSTVSDVLNRYKNDSSYTGDERRGRPKKITARSARKLQYLLKKDPYLTSGELAERVPGKVSRSTIQNFLNSAKYQFILPKKTIFLTKIQKLARLNFCKSMVNYDFSKVVFTDEKKFNLDGPDGLQKAWTGPNSENILLQRQQNRGGSLMIHATISFEKLISIVEMVGNYTAKDYCEMVESKILPLLGLHFGTSCYVWQHDNASIHNANETKRFFERHQIQLLPWPTKSPDLNPVENFFGEITRRVYKNNRQFNSIDELWAKIDEVAGDIKADFYGNLYRSLPERCIETIEKQGGLTKY